MTNHQIRYGVVLAALSGTLVMASGCERDPHRKIDARASDLVQNARGVGTKSGGNGDKSAMPGAHGPHGTTGVPGGSTTEVPEGPYSHLPAPIVFSGEALEGELRRVFGDTPRDRGSVKDGYFKENPTAFFTPSQKQILGNWALTGADDVIRTSWRTSVDQEYLQVLREFLGDACTKLVEDELADDPKAVPDTRKLVGGDVPSVEKTSSFMMKMFGLTGKERLVPGAAELRAVFERSVAAEPSASATQKAALIKRNYILLCVTVGSDPRTYVR